ncbi:hypothetical protein C6P45_004112 [Maudiozyma exigua]|uniref:SWIRM domain-containing protein n=1 Tax=Maudiozyma exigua TaxID=34358 RepID=A0A9P6WGI4_MAUEX|nr:hypothetical protein C6P45_004112 [Kazachstania exigua]
METNSPRPEIFQLNQNYSNPKADALLISLNRKVRWASQEINNNNNFSQYQEGSSSSGNCIDGMIEDRSIPSPPQSPKLLYQKTIDDQLDDGNINVEPSCYRIFKSESSARNINHAQTHTNKFKRPHRYNSASDVERKYRTRRVTRESGLIENELLRPATPKKQQIYAEPRMTKPKTPTKKISLSHGTSPLASAKIIANNSNYIPNMSWEKLPDYAPSVNTLPSDNAKCLKIEWRGSPMDLSHDPLKNRLHPAELILAQVLRLPCDLYLDSKRRFFLEKVCRLRKGLAFRRTDAQKACRIDVNKASRLFAAFEKVGWLNDKNFSKFL